MALDFEAIRKAYPNAVTINDSTGAFDESGNKISLIQYDIDAAIVSLSESPYVESFYPLVVKQQSKKFIPNDTHFAEQWHLQNTGQDGGYSGEAAYVTSAWDNYNGSGVTIGPATPAWSEDLGQ